MGPEEILAALDEAIAKVQTNVQTFEKSCGEVSDQAAVLQGVYKEKTSDLIEQINSLEPEVQTLTNEIIGQVIEGAENANEEVTTTLEETEQELENLIGTQLDALTETYDNTQEQMLTSIDESVGKMQEVAGNFDQIGQSYAEMLENALEKLGNIENQVQEQLNSFIDTLSDDLKSRHDDVLNEVNDFIDNSVNSELVNFFADRDGEFTELGENLIDNLENFGESLSNKFSELSIELIDYTDEKATEEVKDTVNGLIDQIVGELASIISESIVKSSVGVSVTGATSPMMPMLVVFNKLYDALEGAISAWKAFKESFGF